MRSPGCHERDASCVTPAGALFSNGFFVWNGSRAVRPALWVKL
ncbi:MAG: hypothetical protein VZR11_11560 [Succinimonas sp.]|nr:hypothetical protein [Succinimonas sp.]